jgi:hypothetical protein
LLRSAHSCVIAPIIAGGEAAPRVLASGLGETMGLWGSPKPISVPLVAGDRTVGLTAIMAELSAATGMITLERLEKL